MKFKLELFPRNTPEKELIADIKNVARKLKKKTLSNLEYNKYGKFSSSTIITRFGTWLIAQKKAGLNTNRKNKYISKDNVIIDLKFVANKLNKTSLSADEYDTYGKYSSSKICPKFGSWNKALEVAGLAIRKNHNIKEEDLFKNLEKVWIKLGKQPRFAQMIKPVSKYSGATYGTRFGSWSSALKSFIKYIDSSKEDYSKLKKAKIEETNLIWKNILKRKTKRNISNRLKVKVLMRDIKNGEIKCALCNIPLSGPDIHYDHKKAWSNGGETVLKNIQILCKSHNLAKGNLDF